MNSKVDSPLTAPKLKAKLFEPFRVAADVSFEIDIGPPPISSAARD
jgi:hypothetical protein